MSAIPVDAAVIDRIEDGALAVLLVGPDEIELVISIELLPEGAKEGDWMRIAFTADPGLTDERRSDLSARLERIRQDRRGGRFG